jgi:hypothetical protein
MTDTTPLRLKVEALESKYETMRLATLEWGKDVDKLMRWSDQHLQRIMALEAGATCPHIVSSDEGTSYCGLAEQISEATPKQIRSTVKESLTVPTGSLVSRVALAISGIEYGLERDEEAVHWASEARAAIREVVAWMRENECGYNAVRWLEQETER